MEARRANMRTILKGLTVITAAALLWFHGEALLSNRLFLDEPTIHVVKDGEYFSDIAERYYGNPKLWRALALINRAPDANRIYPGEKIILPDARIVAKIARAKRLSDVNEMVRLQEQLAKLEPENHGVPFSGNHVTQPETAHAAAIESAANKDTAMHISEIPAENLSEAKDHIAIPPAALEKNRPPLQASAEGGVSNWLWLPGLTVIIALAAVAVLRRRKNKPVTKLEGKPVDDAPLAANADFKIGAISSDAFWDDLLAKTPQNETGTDASID